MPPDFIDLSGTTDSTIAPSYSEESPANCLASCIKICSGVQDTGEAGGNSNQPRLKFFERAIDARQTIFHGGDRIEGIPVICSGWAAIVSILPNSRRQIVALRLPGDLVSGSLVFEDKLDVSVEAITNVTYRSFDRAEFRTALSNNSCFLESILKIWNEQSSQFKQLIASLGQSTAEQRVAALLVKLLERLTSLGLVTNHSFNFPLRQSHIAEITGLTPVHINRVINSLRRDGLIDLSNRTLTVLDPERLRLICNRKSANVGTRAQQSVFKAQETRQTYRQVYGSR